MAVFQNNLLAGAGAQSSDSTHTIDQSIRFNSADSAVLNKTYSGAGSRTTFTFSCWLKVGDQTDSGSGFPLFNGGTGASDTGWTGIAYYRGTIYIQGYSTNWKLTTRKLRDPSAWYHIVWVWDTTNAVAVERTRLYINGVRETDFSTDNNPGASANAGIGQAQQHSIGYQSRTVGWGYADAYFAEMVFLDGTATDCTSFGEFNSNGIWVPKDVSGLTFGTNGFHIDGRDSADLGDDESGQGNDYTASGLAAHDQVLDSPTNNFCVMNSIENVPCTFTQGNLTIDSTSNFSGAAIRGTVHIKGGSTGKWYYEVVGSLTGDYFSTGWMLSSIITPGSTVIGQDTGSVAFYNTGSYQNGSNAQGAITKPAAGDVIGVGLDASTGQVFLRDDSGYFVGTLSSNALSSGVVITGFSGEDLVMASRNSSSGTATYNFGQDGTFAGAKTAQGNTDANGIGNFFYTVPDGFLAICTKNLGS